MSQVRATLRLQFNHQFTFADAKKLIPYFSQLGISHIYSSPILKSRDDSMHGYDLVDPNLVNPQLGGEEGMIDFVEELKRYGMGLIVDIVPNHMAVGGDANPWWLDLLKWGAIAIMPTSSMFNGNLPTPPCVACYWFHF